MAKISTVGRPAMNGRAMVLRRMNPACEADFVDPSDL
jgi:hypothetical protein